MATTSTAGVIKGFFAPEAPSGAFIKEYKALTDDDKAQLSTGITDGSFTY